MEETSKLHKSPKLLKFGYHPVKIVIWDNLMLPFAQRRVGLQFPSVLCQCVFASKKYGKILKTVSIIYKKILAKCINTTNAHCTRLLLELHGRHGKIGTIRINYHTVLVHWWCRRVQYWFYVRRHLLL